MAQLGTARSSRRNWIVGCLLVFALLLILLGIGGGLVVTQLKAPDGLGFEVYVLAPQSGQMAEVNRPVTVNASASYSVGVTRLELYVDGALVAAQQPQAPPSAPALILIREWLPKTTGRHILVARAYGRDNGQADSPVAYLDVAELVQPTAHITVGEIPQIPSNQPPSLNQVAQGLHIPLNQLQNTNPGLSAVNPDAPLPPDTPLDLPRSPAPPPAPGTPEMTPMGDDPGAVPPVPMPGTPAAPTNLNAVADCALAQLTWVDSPDDEQYLVYRLGPSDVTLNLVATMPQNTTSFSEPLSELGDYRYQVAAVRAGMEGLSPMGTARTPDLCTPPATAPGTASLVLSLITLQTDAPHDHVYCYLQVDSATYERVPTGDFAYLTPDATDARHLQYDLGRQTSGLVPNRGELSLPTHRADAPVLLNAECMGDGISLGTLALSVPREQWDGTARQADSAHLSLRYRVGSNSRPYLREDLARLIGRGPSIDTIIPRPHIDPGSIRFLCDGCNAALPRPEILRIAWTRDACGDILPTDSRITTEQRRALLACILFGVQTAFWELTGAPPPGVTRILPVGYVIHAEAMNVTTRVTNLNWTRVVYPGSHTQTIVPMAPCNSAIRYSVSAFVQVDGVRQQTYFGRDYTVVNTTPCRVEVTVTFDRVQIGPFHHDCFPFCPARPSVPSTIQFKVGRTDQYDRYHTTMTQMKSSDVDDDGGIWLGQETVSLSSQYFRRDIIRSSDPWRDTPSGLMDSGIGRSWATVDLDSPDQRILIVANIWDRSYYIFGGLRHGLSQYAYCSFSLELEARPFAQWVGANVPYQRRLGSSPNYTDYCQYDYHVTGRALEGYRY